MPNRVENRWSIQGLVAIGTLLAMAIAATSAFTSLRTESRLGDEKIRGEVQVLDERDDAILKSLEALTDEIKETTRWRVEHTREWDYHRGREEGQHE